MITIITIKRLEELLRCETIVKAPEHPENDTYAKAFLEMPVVDVKKYLLDIRIDLNMAIQQAEKYSHVWNRLGRIDYTLSRLMRAAE